MAVFFDGTLAHLSTYLKVAVELVESARHAGECLSWRQCVEKLVELLAPQLEELEKEAVHHSNLDPDRLLEWRVKVMAALLARVLDRSNKGSDAVSFFPTLWLDQVLLLAARLGWTLQLSQAVGLVKVGWTRLLLLHGVTDLLLRCRDNAASHAAELELLVLALDVGVGVLLEAETAPTPSQGGTVERDARVWKDAASRLALVLQLLASELPGRRVEGGEDGRALATLLLLVLVLCCVHQAAPVTEKHGQDQETGHALNLAQLPGVAEFKSVMDASGPGILAAPVRVLCRQLQAVLAASDRASVCGHLCQSLKTLRQRFPCLAALSPRHLQQSLEVGATSVPAAAARECLAGLTVFVIAGEREYFQRRESGVLQESLSRPTAGSESSLAEQYGELSKTLTGVQDIGTQDTGTQNSGTRDSGTLDSETQDSGTQDSGTRDSGTQDSGTQDTGTRNSGTQDSGTQGSGTWDSGTRNSGTRNSGTQDTGTQDTGTQDSGTQDCGTQDCGTQDSGTQDSENGTGDCGTGTRDDGTGTWDYTTGTGDYVTGTGDCGTWTDSSGSVEEVDLLWLLQWVCSAGTGQAGSTDTHVDRGEGGQGDGGDEVGGQGEENWGDAVPGVEVKALLQELELDSGEEAAAETWRMATGRMEPDWLTVLCLRAPAFQGAVRALLSCGLTCVNEELHQEQQARGRRVLELERDLVEAQSCPSADPTAPNLLLERMELEAKQLCLELCALLPMCVLDYLLAEGVRGGWLPLPTPQQLTWDQMTLTFNRLTPDLPTKILTEIAGCFLLDVRATMRWAVLAAFKNVDQTKMIVEVLRQFPELCGAVVEGGQLPLLAETLTSVLKEEICLSDTEEQFLASFILQCVMAFQVKSSVPEMAAWHWQPGILSPHLAACLVLAPPSPPCADNPPLQGQRSQVCPVPAGEGVVLELSEDRRKPVATVTALTVLWGLVQLGGSCVGGEWGRLWGWVGPPLLQALGGLLSDTACLRHSRQPHCRTTLRCKVQTLLAELATCPSLAACCPAPQSGGAVWLAGLDWQTRWRLSTVLQTWAVPPPEPSTMAEKLAEPMEEEGVLATVLQASTLTKDHAQLLPLVENIQASGETTIAILARLLPDMGTEEVERLLDFLVLLASSHPGLLPAPHPLFESSGTPSPPGELGPIIQALGVLRDVLVVLVRAATKTDDRDQSSLCCNSHLPFVLQTSTSALKAAVDSHCRVLSPELQVALCVEVNLHLLAVRCLVAWQQELSTSLDVFSQHLLHRVKAIVCGGKTPPLPVVQQWSACLPRLLLAFRTSQADQSTTRLLEQIGS